MHARLLLAASLSLFAGRAHAAAVASVFGARVPCVLHSSGVQFCQGKVTTRIESFDGVPLDVDVTLPPPSMDGPFPLIVELHGWGQGKTDTPFVTEANAGYAVLSYTARGFLGSCGSMAARAPDPTLSNPNVCAERGWTRLADVRYEAHDSQHLAGLLADDGLVIPDKVGVTGISYGGGQSFILAALRNRVMMPDGTLVPWKSPGGRDMAIAAAAPIIGWTDLSEALTPAGRTLDYRTDNPYPNRGGVQKESWNALLYTAGLLSGFYAAPGVDPQADLTVWNDRLNAGEPYDTDPTLVAARAEITAHHSAYYVDDSVTPAPLFVYNSWTDDLFPADEALRYYRKIRADHSDADISLHFEAGFGHPRAGLSLDLTRITNRVMQHFDRHLKGVGDPLPPVETFTQACGSSTELGPFTATNWDKLRRGEVRYGSRARQQFAADNGHNTVATQIAKSDDPLNGGPCRTIATTDAPFAASYTFPSVRGKGFTLMGAPTVIARLTVQGHFAQVVARLWDVGPDGMQTLVTHAIYRPRTDNRNPQPFQLHPNGWLFTAGHRPKLELVGGSEPYGRLVHRDWSVAVDHLQLRLPVLERPGGIVRAKARPVQPPKAAEPPDTGS